MKTPQKTKPRALHVIANEIVREWKNPPYYAMAYLAPMQQLESVDDKFVFETGKAIVLGFLANAQSFRGEKARDLKKELKELVA